MLYNNTCSFCIFIGRELCVIKVYTHGWRQLMAWSNLANSFRGSSHDFCQLYYNIKQIDFIFLCFCTVIDHRWRHSVWRTKSHALDCVSCVLFCSSHAMTSSVIYYSTDAQKNEIYLFYSWWQRSPIVSLLEEWHVVNLTTGTPPEHGYIAIIIRRRMYRSLIWSRNSSRSGIAI